MTRTLQDSHQFLGPRRQVEDSAARLLPPRPWHSLLRGTIPGRHARRLLSSRGCSHARLLRRSRLPQEQQGFRRTRQDDVGDPPPSTGLRCEDAVGYWSDRYVMKPRACMIAPIRPRNGQQIGKTWPMFEYANSGLPLAIGGSTRRSATSSRDAVARVIG